jgi:ornithine cyclodeaminase/alanine dehydrogenase-like protein (mu-crystallin family)
MKECVEVMSAALQALSRGEVIQPVRSVLRLPDGSGLLGIMPAILGHDAGVTAGGARRTSSLLGLKVITVMPGNHGTPYDSHQGAVLLFEADHGRLLAILDASAVTRIRTAAVSATATRALANPDAGDLAILGSGVQAAAHLEAMLAVRPVTRVRVWSRNAESARRFAADATVNHGLPVEAAPDARDAVRGASIICTTTAAGEPILRGAWIAPGAHVNAVGACTPPARELDTDAVRRATLFVDDRAAALAEAGDLLIPIREGALTEAHITAELGDVLTGRHPGRRTRAEVTLFKSLGLAVEDLAAAARLYANALAAGAGTAIRLGGRRDPRP